MPCASFAKGSMMLADSTRVIDIAITLSIVGSPRLGDRFANDFLERCQAAANLVQTRFAQRDHAVIDRLLSQFKCGSANQDQLTNLVGDFHHFIKADSPFVTGVIARRTSLTLVSLDGLRFIKLQTNFD